MASTSKDQQKEKTLPIVNPGGDHSEEEAALPFSVTQALQNDLVLDNMFSYLSVPDLKACRQVCQQWKQASRRSLVEKCNRVGFFGRSVRFRFPDGFKRFHRIVGMARLSGVISSGISSEFPVTKFFVDTYLTTDIPENMDALGLEKILREFFLAIGPLATQLEIGPMNAGKLFQLDAPLNAEFLRLKTLKASWEPDSFPPGIDVTRSNLIFFQNVLENAPQLSTLDIGVARSETMDLLINLMERVLPGRKISTLRLTSRTELRDSHLHSLANLGLKLTSLRVDLGIEHLKEVDPRGRRHEGWMKFLESQGETLEKLYVVLCCGSWEQRPFWSIGFPCLRKLKRLTVASSYLIKLSKICYKKQFPSLEQLSLISSHDGIMDAFLNFDHPPVENVEILELPNISDDSGWIWHAARIFPNVKKLKIQGCREVLQAVFQAWLNVEELTIIDSGYSVDQLLAVNFQGVLPSSQGLPTSGMPAKFLQDLKTLRLVGSFWRRAPSARICHFVLLKMGSLTCFDLSKCGNPVSQIDESMLSKMREKFLVLY